MIKSVDQMTVSSIFSINSDKVYRIPKYQREYTWGVNDWNALFDDVTDNEPGYFLGSFICVSSGALNGTILELIDGQQRFSTLSLLMAAIYEKLASKKEQLEPEEATDLNNLRRELANQKEISSGTAKRCYEYAQRILLQKQNMNDEDYSYILSSKGIITKTVTKPSNFGNRRIAKAYKHFVKRLDEEIELKLVENSELDEISILMDIKAKFEKAVLVGIEVDTNKDAYMLFESLNHRGVPLSALDLIKNTLIAQTVNDHDADECYDKWKQILMYIGQDDYSVQERFFRQYYNAYRDELNKPYKNTDKKYPLGYLATRTTLLDIYEQMLKNDYRKLLDDLTVKAQKYSVIVNNSDEDYAYSTSMLELSRISGAPSYMLLMYIMSEQIELELSVNAII